MKANRLAALTASIAMGIAGSAWASPIVTNGDFESNGGSFTAFPGYIGDAGNPASITGWTSTGVGRTGINNGNVGGPGNAFNDTGNDTTNVAFMQANPSPTGLSQSVSGFTPGSTYAVTFNYSARNCCGDNPDLSLTLGSQTRPIGSRIAAVGGANPLYKVSVPFTASAATQTLAFNTINHGSDATSTLDNVVIQEVTSIAINNPSFEANSNAGVGYGPITGWTQAGDGSWGTNPGAAGNFFIPGHTGANATPPDGSQVAFSQGANTLTQTINGLVPGTTYTLTYFDGHRNGDSGGEGDTLAASIGGVTLGTNAPKIDGYNARAYNFIATATSEDLVFTHGNITGDQSIAIDAVSITTPVAVPEPATLGLCLSAAALLARRRRA